MFLSEDFLYYLLNLIKNSRECDTINWFCATMTRMYHKKQKGLTNNRNESSGFFSLESILNTILCNNNSFEKKNIRMNVIKIIQKKPI